MLSFQKAIVVYFIVSCRLVSKGRSSSLRALALVGGAKLAPCARRSAAHLRLASSNLLLLRELAKLCDCKLLVCFVLLVLLCKLCVASAEPWANLNILRLQQSRRDSVTLLLLTGGRVDLLSVLLLPPWRRCCCVCGSSAGRVIAAAGQVCCRRMWLQVKLVSLLLCRDVVACCVCVASSSSPSTLALIGRVRRYQ